MLYVFGHKAPDTDSICSAIAYAYLKNKLGTEAEPCRLGEVNSETKLVLERFNAEKPKMLESAEGKDVILVDHNEFEQSAKGIERANILEIVDHHKMKFSWDKPITIITLPWGSTATIITKLFSYHRIEIPREIAGLLLSAILSDTVIFRSPTCTEIDREVAKKLAETAGIDNVQEWGIKMFRAKSAIAEKSARDIIFNDYKVYDFSGRKVLIGQIEVVSDEEVLERKEEILEEMERLRQEENYYAVLLMVTDIMKQGSTLLLASESSEPFEKAFNAKFEQSSAYLQGVMSRKKQVVPPLERVFSG